MDFVATRIVEVERPEPGYALLRFAGERPIVGEPGQFVMVRGDWELDPILPRAFSLVESGDPAAILVRAVGRGTERLVAMRKGDLLQVLGPLGRGFTPVRDGLRPVLVAGGVGVAPLVFLAERLTRVGPPPITIYGGRTASDLVLRARLAACGNLSVTTEDGSLGEAGIVTTPLERVLAGDQQVRVFSCGPEGMLRAVARSADLADAPCEVALESPMACGVGTCKGCAHLAADGSYRYVCSDGPVFDALEIFGGVR